MARYRGPRKKYLKRFGLLPDTPPDFKQQMRRRKSDYGIRLEEKQRLKFIYGVLEKQFRRYVQEAMNSATNSGEVLLALLEKRLDNVVYRLGFAKTRPQARQLVVHGHVLVNGKVVDRPSYRVRPGEVISLQPRMQENAFVQESLKKQDPSALPAWLERQGSVGRVLRELAEGDLRDDVDTNLIIEFYSR